jgi:hypothetical protein
LFLYEGILTKAISRISLPTSYLPNI